MSEKPRGSIVNALIGHLVMGAALGTLLALSLMLLDNGHIFHMIADSQSPTATAIVFVGSFTLIFAIGAGFSGFLFIVAA